MLSAIINKSNLKKGRNYTKTIVITPRHVPALIVLTESLLLQSRHIDAEVFLNQADQLDIHNKHKGPIKTLRRIIQKSYDQHLLGTQAIYLKNFLIDLTSILRVSILTLTIKYDKESI